MKPPLDGAGLVAEVAKGPKRAVGVNSPVAQLDIVSVPICN
jgi:hypothetical protein